MVGFSQGWSTSDSFLRPILSKHCSQPLPIVLHEGNYKINFLSLPRKEHKTFPHKSSFCANFNCLLNLGKEKNHLHLKCVMKQCHQCKLVVKADISHLYRSCERGLHVGRVQFPFENQQKLYYDVIFILERGGLVMRKIFREERKKNFNSFASHFWF